MSDLTTFKPGDIVRVRLSMDCEFLRDENSSARAVGITHGHPAAMNGAKGVVVERSPRKSHADQGHTIQVRFIDLIPIGDGGFWVQDSFSPDELEALS